MTSHVSRGTRTSHVAQRSTSTLFHAGGREAEIEEVFRRILADRRAARPGRDRLRLRRARRAGLGEGAAPRVAGHARAGHRGAVHPPGRALIGFCDWIETDFSAGHLRRLLQSGDMGIEEEDEGFTAGQAARTLARAEAGLGTRDLRAVARTARKELRGARQRSGSVGRRARGGAEEGGADARRSPAGSRRLIAAIPEAVRERQGSAAGRRRRRRSTFLERSTVAREPARSPRRGGAGRLRRGAARAGRVRVLARRGAALHPRARRVAAGRAPSVRVPATSTPAAFSRPATPAARISSSSGSKKAACSRRRPKIPCCSTPSARRSRRRCSAPTDRIDEAV